MGGAAGVGGGVPGQAGLNVNALTPAQLQQFQQLRQQAQAQQQAVGGAQQFVPGPQQLMNMNGMTNMNMGMNMPGAVPMQARQQP